MPIQQMLLDKGRGIMRRAHGLVSPIEIRNAINGQKDHMTDVCYKILDYSDMESFSGSGEDIRNLVRVWDSAMREHAHIVGAAIAESPFSYGMARMWSAYMEDSPVTFELFRSRDVAESWLKERVENKFGHDLNFTPINSIPCVYTQESL